MLRELRKMRAKGGAERAKANYIGTLQARGILRRYQSAKGYICYDTEELKRYKANRKLGRPFKDGFERGTEKRN